MALAAGIVAGGSLIGGLGGALIQSNAAQSAAQTQAGAEMAALNAANTNLQPILAQGKALAGPAQAQLTGFLTNPAAALQNYPGYQFALGQTEKAAMNAGTVMGLGGNTLYGLSQNVAGITSQYENQYFQQLYNTLALGLNTQVGAAGTLTGAQTAALTGIGNAQAAGTLGSANALAGGLNTATGGLSSAGLIYALGSQTAGGLTATPVNPNLTASIVQ
jgi:hypothetical protein